MSSKMEARIDKQERQLCRFLQQVVRVPTVNPPGENYLECVSIFEDKLKSLGMTTRVVKVPQALVREHVPGADGCPRYNLIARWDVGAKETIHFNGHYDVVPVNGKWKYGPFEPKIDNGWLYGRGSSDMKGPNAALCFALQAIQKSGTTPRVNVEVSFTCDEEIGGVLGAGYVAAKGLAKADYVVVLEGACGKKVGCGHNGILWLDVEVAGRSAHASSPQKGINAFENMSALTMELRKIKEQFPKRTYTTPEGKDLHPTMNIGGSFHVGEGAKVNTVPASASFTIDRRVIPSEKIKNARDEIVRRIRDSKKDIPALRTKVSQRLALDPCLTSTESKIAVNMARAVQKAKGGRPKYSVTQGFTDLHFFVNEGGMPGVGYGAAGKNIHAIDERVNIRDLVQTSKVYAHLISDWE